MDINHILINIKSVVNGVPTQVWVTLFGGVAVAISSEAFKIINQIKSNSRMRVLVTILSGAYAVVMYLINTRPDLPWVALIQGLAVYASSQPVYFKAVKPLRQIVTAKLAQSNLKEEAQSAVIPPEGLPTSGPVGPEATPVTPLMSSVDVNNFS